MQWKNSLIAAFGSTCRVKGGPEDDANIKALIDSHTPVCTIFGKTWTLHVKEVLLTTTLEDNLRIIEQSCRISQSRMANESSTTPSISSTATKLDRRTRSRHCEPQSAAEQRLLCCAIRTAAQCPGGQNQLLAW
ncbi:MAG: hypothetical protein U0X92_18290 [Anaerolineales bacterium]